MQKGDEAMCTRKKFCWRVRLASREVDLSDTETVYGKEWGHGRGSGESFLPHLGMGVVPGLGAFRARLRHLPSSPATECLED